MDLDHFPVLIFVRRPAETKIMFTLKKLRELGTQYLYFLKRTLSYSFYSYSFIFALIFKFIEMFLTDFKYG